MSAAAACVAPHPHLPPGNSPPAVSCPPGGTCTPQSTAQCAARPLEAPSPESAVKRLITTIDCLQLQQAHAEERRLAAERDAAAAHAEAASLKAQLHASLLQLAELDDREDAARMALDARLLKRGQAEEQLRLLRVRLAALRLQTGGGEAGDAAAAEAAFTAELAARQALAAELQQRLRQAGVTDAALAQLCSTAAAHSTAAGGQQQRAAAEPQGSSADAAPPRPAWLGGSGPSGGLLGSFRRRAGAAG